MTVCPKCGSRSIYSVYNAEARDMVGYHCIRCAKSFTKEEVGETIRFWTVMRKDAADYDEYDGAVIAAYTPEEALSFCESSNGWRPNETWTGFYSDNVTITEITPQNFSIPGIIMTDFHAG